MFTQSHLSLASHLIFRAAFWGAIFLHLVASAEAARTLSPPLETPTISIKQYISSPFSPKAGGSFSFIVEVRGTSASPTGTVVIEVNGIEYTSLTLSGGMTGFGFEVLNAGGYAFTAKYSGDSVYAATTYTLSFGVPAIQVFLDNQVQGATSPIVYGSSVSVTTFLKNEPRAPAIVGTVSYYLEDKLVGVVDVSSGSTVTSFTFGQLAPGSYNGRAVYSGSANHTPASKEFSIGINRASATTTLTSSVNSITYGQSVTFTAKLSAKFPTQTSILPNGLVSFLVDDQQVALIELANGGATYTTSSLASGNHTIAATYLGSGYFYEGTPVALPITVNPPCSVTLESPTKGFTEIGGTGSVNLSATGTCTSLTPTADDWITLTDVTATKVGYRVAALTTGPDRTGTITIGGATFTIYQKKTVAAVSGASFITSDIAPGEIVSAFGAGLADQTVTAIALPLPTKLGGIEVSIRDSANNERLARLFYVSPTQINYSIPLDVALGNATVTFYKDGAVVSTATTKITAYAPGIFSANQNGGGVAAATIQRIKADNTVTYEDTADYDTTQKQYVARSISLGNGTDTFCLALYGTGLRGLTSANVITAMIREALVTAVYVRK